MSSTVRRVAAVALLVLATAWFGGTSPASAHAVLLSSNPADGATLQSAPPELRLVFDEDVTVDSTSFHLVDGDGRSIPLPAASALDEPGAGEAKVVGVILPRLADARYLVRWDSITSDDFHPVNGSFTFGVGVDVQAAGPRTDRQLGSPLESLLRAEVLVGFVVVVGALVLSLRLRPMIAGDPRTRRVLRRTAAIGEIASLLGLVSLLGLLMYDSGSAPPPSFLAYWGLSAVGIVAAAMCCRRALLPATDEASATIGDISLWVGLASITVAAFGLGHLGHASATSGSLLSTAHVLATAVWTGGVAVLTVVVLSVRRHDAELARAATRRFGAVAVPAILVSTFTGLLLARPLVPAQDGLTDTGYGHGLLLKLAFVAVAIALGGLAFWRVRRGTGRHQGIRLGAELAVMGGILLVAASMSAGQPPDDSRWLPNPTTEPTVGLLSSDVDDLVITLTLSPGVPGPNFATVGVLDTRRPSPAKVTGVLVGLGSGVAVPAVQQIESDSAPVFPGAAPNTTWVASSPVTASGAHDVTVTVRRDGEPDGVATFAWQVAPLPGAETGGPSISGLWSLLAVAVAGVAVLTLGADVWRRRRRHTVLDDDTPDHAFDDEGVRV